MIEREPIFADLRTMYEQLDPPPPGLVADMIAAVAAEDLDTEYELLTLLSRTSELKGARGSGPLTIELAYDDISVLIRVADGPGEGRRRLDGWITPAADGRVGVAAGDQELTADLVDGRFEVPDAPSGLIRIWFRVPGRDDLATPTFEI